MIAYETAELGPMIGSQIANFTLPDHNNEPQAVAELVGGTGLLLGFIGDIWQPTSVRRILWLQRHLHKFALMGTPVALLVRDEPHTLYGFHSSSPLPVPFPLLADRDGSVHLEYAMDRHPGLLLLGTDLTVHEKWLVPDDRVWPKLNELMDAVQHIQASV